MSFFEKNILLKQILHSLLNLKQNWQRPKKIWQVITPDQRIRCKELYMFHFRVIVDQFKVFVVLKAQLLQSATLANKLNQSAFSFFNQFKVILISFCFLRSI